MATSKKTSKPVSTPVARNTEQIGGMPAYQEPPSTIVQNISEGYVCISDLNLTFGPFEIQDLNHIPQEQLDRSINLRTTLRKGLLQKISLSEYDRILDKQIAREQKAASQAREQRRRSMVQVDEDIKFDAEIVDLNSSNVTHNSEAISTKGYANDPTTYAMAYAQAKEEARRYGETLDPEDFAQRISKNPGILNKYLTVSSNNGVASGDLNRGRATVIMPPDEFGGTSVAQMNMTNFNRDQRIAGNTNEGISFLDGTAEEIDLALDTMQDITPKRK